MGTSKVSGGSTNWVDNKTYTAPSPKSASTAATIGPKGAVKGITVQQLATPQASGQRSGIGQKIASFFTTSLPNFFKDPVGTIRSLISPGSAAHAAPSPAKPQASATTAQATAAPASTVRTFAENRAALQDVMPAGVTVDAQGIVSGTYHPVKFADDFVGPQAGRTIIDVAQQSATNQLTPAPGKTLPTVSGIPCSPQATSDFFRLNLVVHNATGDFNTRNDTETAQSTRNAHVMDAIKGLTNDDNTATVLSSLINQNLSRYALETMEKADGSYAKFQPNSPMFTQAIMTRANDGTTADERPKGIGDAPMSLSRLPNGNYKFEVTFENLFTQSGRGNDKADLPGMGGAAIRAVSHLEFEVDGGAAQQGRLVVTMPTPATTTFSGRMLPQS